MNAKQCDHMTLRKPNQPCPHPECGGVQRFIEALHPLPVHYCDADPPCAPGPQRRVWDRGEIVMRDGTRFFAWREAGPPQAALKTSVKSVEPV